VRGQSARMLTRLLLFTGLALAALLSSLTPAASADVRSSIVSIAESQDQYGSAIVNNPATTADGGCNPYTAY